jgi:hypothetical protein
MAAQSDAGTDRRLLLLHPDDNVLVTRAPIATGEHVHVHNLASDYTASISLQGAST